MKWSKAFLEGFSCFPISKVWNYIFILLPKVLNQILKRHFNCVFSQNHWHFCIFYLAASESLLLLVASRNQIVADNITSQGHNVQSLIQNGSHIVAIDFDSVSGRIFWSDGTQGKIWSALQNGTDSKVVSTFLLTCDLPGFLVLGLFSITYQWERPYLTLGSSHLFWATSCPRGLNFHNSSFMGVLDKNVASESRFMFFDSRSIMQRFHKVSEVPFVIFFFSCGWKQRKMQGVKGVFFLDLI